MSILICRIFILSFCFIFIPIILNKFDSFWLSFAYKVTTGTYNFVFHSKNKIIKIAISIIITRCSQNIILCFNSSFNSILQLINDVSSDLQNLFKYFNGTVIVAFLRNPLA